MITTQNLTKTYSTNTVLNIESLEIPKGQCFGLVGNNGAGKTTFFSLLLDLIQPTTGHIDNNGVQVNTSEDWKPFTSAFIDETFLIGYLTAEEYFYFIGELRGQNKADVDALLAGFQDFFHGEIKQIIKDLAAQQDVTVLVSSHDLIHVTEVCERIVVLNKGEVVKDINTSTETLKELEVFFAG